MKYPALLLLLLLSSFSVQEPTAEIALYFCPQDHCQEKIIEVIDASTDIKCAFFELNLPELIQKLEEKNAQVVIEDKYALDQFHSGYSFALMHNKFCVFDNKTIFTGSMNPTERGNYYNNNNILIINSTTLAKNYLAEFDELLNNEYGNGKKTKTTKVKLGDVLVENYFCPEDNCKLQVINTLKKANSSIYFMTFSFTDEDIGNLLWNKNYLGLDVQGRMEKRQLGSHSRFEDLQNFTITDYNPYTMHHKVFIIDEKTVITGSYNPTKNANENNDENILIIHDEEIAQKFLVEFKRLQKEDKEIPKETTNVILNKVMYNAVGSDKGNEFVEVKNIGNKTMDLGYYFLSNNKTNFRLEGVLSPDETIIIKPSFSLKNTDGLLLLKEHQQVIDMVAWEGLWELNVEEGEHLTRKFYEINENAWTS